MNPTIDKIVRLLFEDLAETEEVIAIREEVLINCQERYQDQREAGISEDDAIRAVIESLSGMEEMLSEYPRKTDTPAEAPEAPETPVQEDTRTWSCRPADSPIHEIRMEHMGAADIYVSVSPDDLVHTECSDASLTLITGTENGVLTIALSDQKPEEVKDEIKFSLQDGIDLASISKLFEKLAKRFVSAVKLNGVQITLALPAALCPALHIGTSSGDAAIEALKLERLHIGTASGDVELNGTSITQELRITSASGDITLNDVQAQQIRLSSTSGDVEANACFAKEAGKANTTSGDITWCGRCQTLEVNSVSGDISLEVSAETLAFRTVSGDAEITLKGEQLHSLSGSTTSGDIDVTLPEGLPADVHLSAVSSHIESRVNHVPGAPAVVKLSTVSGDMEIR